MTADEAATTQSEDTQMTSSGVPEGKGKGKAVDPAPDVMDDDDESSEEEDQDHDLVEEGDDEDNMEEIDTNNIIEGGRRTRGKTIDFAEAAKNAEDLPEDEDDDDDFELNDHDAMEE